MPGKTERQTFDSGKAAPEVQPAPTTVPELPGSNSAAQDQARGIGGIRESEPPPDTPTLDAANAELEALNAESGGGDGSGSATVAYSAGGRESAYEKGGGGFYTQALLKAKRDNPGKSIDELVTEMADFQAAEGKQHADVVKVGGSKAKGGGNKVGVVVANWDYRFVGDLPGAKTDAQAMMGAYGGEFKMTLHENLRKGGIAGAATRGMQGLKRGDHLLFYYAGHGVQAGLLGVDGKWSDAKSAVFPRGAVLGLVNRARTQGFHMTAILDSCQSGAVGQAVSDLRLSELEKDKDLSADARKLVAIAKRLEKVRGNLLGRVSNPNVRKRKPVKTGATAPTGAASAGASTRGSLGLSGAARGGTLESGPPDPKFEVLETCANDFKGQTGSDTLNKELTTSANWQRQNIGWRRDVVARMVAITLEHIEEKAEST
jgi:hypothetical protein